MRKLKEGEIGGQRPEVSRLGRGYSEPRRTAGKRGTQEEACALALLLAASAAQIS